MKQVLSLCETDNFTKLSEYDLDRKVYRTEPTDTGLLLHYHSHVDMKYKHSLFKPMLNRAFKLSSNWHFFNKNANA